MRAAAALLAVMLLSLSGCQPPPSEAVLHRQETTGQSTAEQKPETLYLQNIYEEPQLLGAALSAPTAYELHEGRLHGGMIPHHLLAADMIAGFFSLAEAQHREEPYDGVLLLSPSHFSENCASLITTGLAGWKTSEGAIEPDTEVIKAILQNDKLAAENNPAALEQDHGCAGLTPLISRYLPDVPLAVVLLSNKLPKERLEVFWQEVQTLASEQNLLVIASSDCSHYLPYDAAQKRDEETIRAISEQDFYALLAFDDRNLDSPQAVTSLLKAGETTDSEILLLMRSASDEKLPHAQSNSTFDEGVTSYLVYALVGQEK